jgi:hypothetical protein
MTLTNGLTRLPAKRSPRFATTPKRPIKRREFTLNFNGDLFSTLFWYDQTLTGSGKKLRD